MKGTWLTIDPGISGTGWAQFDNDTLHAYGIVNPKGSDWEEKCNYVCDVFRKWGLVYTHTFIEWPSNFMGSRRGMAAVNSGALLKLSFLIGRLAELLQPASLIAVNVWKGSLPKELVKKRAEEYFKRKGFKSHAADAVGLGQYIIKKGPYV